MSIWFQKQKQNQKSSGINLSLWERKLRSTKGHWSNSQGGEGCIQWSDVPLFGRHVTHQARPKGLSYPGTK
jgi:hypothetical protein